MKSRPSLSCRFALALFLSCLACPLSALATARGMPFLRSYSLEEIGYVPRGAFLDFDRFGRVAVIHDGVYAVLNDTSWINISGHQTDHVAVLNVLTARDGEMYYGGRASWGIAELRADGLLHARTLAPEHPPEWVHSATFEQLFETDDGIYFIGPNGAIFWNKRTKNTQFYKIARAARCFQIGQRVYISAFERSLRYINPVKGTLEGVPPTILDSDVVMNATTLDERSVLLYLDSGRYVTFDGATVKAWAHDARYHLEGAVSSLQHLVDGNIALAKTGEGLFILSPKGELLLRLDAPDYCRITALANREPGVLWLATENGIEKVLYSSALTAFGQQLGIAAGWPIIDQWRGHIYAESEGKLYRAVEGQMGAPTRFELFPEQPEKGVWALAAAGDRMLVGGANTVFIASDNDTLQPIAAVPDLAHLVMPDENHCFAIGRKEIAYLEWSDGKWVERTPRIPGVSYPSVSHRIGNSAWIELGGEVGRLTQHNGKLIFDRIANSSWTQTPWVNIGALDHLVMLTGNFGERRFFDETTGKWVDAPSITALLARSPFWISRIIKDESGTIWATHDEGLVRFTPRNATYDMDTQTFDFINDRYPQVRVLPGNDIWVMASRSLYHVETRWPSLTATSSLHPILVSMIDNTGAELLPNLVSGTNRLILPYERNGLSLRFFSGSYAGRRPLSYEYRLTEREPWTPLSGSQLTLRGLHSGEHNLQVRFSGRPGDNTDITTVTFAILSPWYRSLPAYIIFGLATAGALFGAFLWTNYLQRARNLQLEKLIAERTHQLRETMEKLSEETRNAAVLAERNRLANEIHDSVQQGLTGAILQLDTTLKLPDFAEKFRPRLDVVRNMISYARQEVQHAVWDMESPLLETDGLAAALKNLVTFINADALTITVTVSGEERPLDRITKHNLLRIAQEASNNAIRHSQAHNLNIALTYTPASVELALKDDGVGFDPNEVLHLRTGHLGLRGIRTRVKKLRGSLEIDSGPHRGTRIRIEVPPLAESNAEPI